MITILKISELIIKLQKQQFTNHHNYKLIKTNLSINLQKHGGEALPMML